MIILLLKYLQTDFQSHCWQKISKECIEYTLLSLHYCVYHYTTASSCKKFQSCRYASVIGNASRLHAQAHALLTPPPPFLISVTCNKKYMCSYHTNVFCTKLQRGRAAVQKDYGITSCHSNVRRCSQCKEQTLPKIVILVAFIKLCTGDCIYV